MASHGALRRIYGPFVKGLAFPIVGDVWQQSLADFNSTLLEFCILVRCYSSSTWIFDLDFLAASRD